MAAAGIGMACSAMQKRRSSSWQRELQDRDRNQSSAWQRELQDQEIRQSSSCSIEREQQQKERSSSYQIRNDVESRSSSETHSVANKARLSIGSFRTVLFTEFPTDDVLMSGILWKKVFLSSEVWQSRQVAITKDEIAFARPGEQLMIDRIPLLDITLIHRRSEDESTSKSRLRENEFRREERGLQALPSRKLGSQVRKGFGQHESSGHEGTANEESGGSGGAGPGEVGKKLEDVDAGSFSTFSQLRRSSSPFRAGSLIDSVRKSVRKMSLSGARQAGGGKGTMLVIHTREGGYNSGMPYFLQGESDAEVQEWVSTLKSAVRAAFKRRAREVHVSRWAHFRHRVGVHFASPKTQFLVAAVILVNFAANVLSAELLPAPGTSMFRSLELIELGCTVGFSIELAVNLLVHSVREFWSDGWNYFDLAAVSASLLAFFTEGLPGFGVFRLIRVFRVIRLFHKLSSMRVIINAFMASCKPVLTAFVVVLLVTCLYAVLAVEFFHERQPVYFGSFSKAVFTLCQIATGDDWGMISRISFKNGAESWDPPVALFFLSYVVLVGIVLLNIVVAVLLDEFIQSMARERWLSQQQQAAIEDPGAKTASSLDPILSTFASLNDADDVTSRVQDLFELLDAPRQAGALRYPDLAEGLRKLEFDQVINLSREDFEGITQDGALCDAEGSLTCEGFHKMFRRQLHLFVQRRIANELRAVDGRESDTALGTVLYDLKQLNVRVDELHTRGENAQDRMSNQLAVLADKIDQLLKPSLTRAPGVGNENLTDAKDWNDDIDNDNGADNVKRCASSRSQCADHDGNADSNDSNAIHANTANNNKNKKNSERNANLAPGFFNKRSQCLRAQLEDKMVVPSRASRSLATASRQPSDTRSELIEVQSSTERAGFGARPGSSGGAVGLCGTFRSTPSFRRTPSSRCDRSAEPSAGSGPFPVQGRLLPAPIRNESEHNPEMTSGNAKPKLARRNSWHAVNTRAKQSDAESSQGGGRIQPDKRVQSSWKTRSSGQQSGEDCAVHNSSHQRRGPRSRASLDMIVSASPSTQAPHPTRARLSAALLGQRQSCWTPCPSLSASGPELVEASSSSWIGKPASESRVGEAGPAASAEGARLHHTVGEGSWQCEEEEEAALLAAQAPMGRSSARSSLSASDQAEARRSTDSIASFTPSEIERFGICEDGDDESETDLGQGGVIWVSPLVRNPSFAGRTSVVSSATHPRASAMPAAVKRVSHWLRGISRIAGGERPASSERPERARSADTRQDHHDRDADARHVAGGFHASRQRLSLDMLSDRSRRCLGDSELARINAIGINRTASSHADADRDGVVLSV